MMPFQLNRKSINQFKVCFCLFVIIIFIRTVHRIVTCDEVAEGRSVQTPNGLYIPKFEKNLKVKSFSNLTKRCLYINDKVDCPDIRVHGETMLRQVQLTLIRMLKIIDLICTKHSINYWLMSGTLLGAYREKGYIQWDNDGDVGFLEDDYEKFVKYLKSDLPSDLYFQDGSDEPEYKKHKFCAGKLRDRNSCYGHCMRTGCKWHDGLQIDMFMFKKTPNSNSIVSVTTGRFLLNYQDVFPTKKILLDGIELSAPSKIEAVLTTLFGKTFMTPVGSKCPQYGFIAIPWYSCEYIESLQSSSKNKILIDSMVHDSWFFWYFG